MRSGFSSASCSISTLKKRLVRFTGYRSPSLYTKGMSCAICRTRRPRRACPGIHADICAVCCGREREVTVTCPFSCVYLQVARKLQPSAEFDAAVMGNPDITVTAEFLESHPELMLAANGALGMAAAQNGAVDSDVREALASLIQTYRTL